jgi:hypothetical protein
MEKKVEREPSRRQIKNVIAATNNHYKGQAAVNAIDLKRLLGIKDNLVPQEFLKAYPQLGGESAEGKRLLPRSRGAKVDQAAGSESGTNRSGFIQPKPDGRGSRLSNRHSFS